MVAVPNMDDMAGVDEFLAADRDEFSVPQLEMERPAEAHLASVAAQDIRIIGVIVAVATDQAVVVLMFEIAGCIYTVAEVYYTRN